MPKPQQHTTRNRSPNTAPERRSLGVFKWTITCRRPVILDVMPQYAVSSHWSDFALTSWSPNGSYYRHTSFRQVHRGEHSILKFTATAALILVSIGALIVFCFASAKWEVERRKSVGARLDQLSTAVEATPKESPAYSALAKATAASDRWDRTAAFVEIKRLARSIVANQDSHELFRIHFVPVLQNGLTDNDPYIRSAAAMAACRYGPLVASIKNTLLQVAREHPNEGCAWFSVRAIGEIGPEATGMIDALNALSQHNVMIADEVEKAVKKLRVAQESKKPA